MSIIIREGTFFPTPAAPTTFVSVEDLQEQGSGPIYLDLANTVSVDVLVDFFDRIKLIRIDFPQFADGRGYSMARRLRLLGYRGVLRASGHVIPDQYRHAIRAGFDEVEIDTAAAERQPEPHWQAQLNALSPSYQDRITRPQL